MGTALVCLASGRLNFGNVDLDSDFGVGVVMAAGEERRWMLRRTRQVVTRTPMTTRKGRKEIRCLEILIRLVMLAVTISFPLLLFSFSLESVFLFFS